MLLILINMKSQLNCFYIFMKSRFVTQKAKSLESNKKKNIKC